MCDVCCVMCDVWCVMCDVWCICVVWCICDVFVMLLCVMLMWCCVFWICAMFTIEMKLSLYDWDVFVYLCVSRIVYTFVHVLCLDDAGFQRIETLLRDHHRWNRNGASWPIIAYTNGHVIKADIRSERLWYPSGTCMLRLGCCQQWRQQLRHFADSKPFPQMCTL